MNKCVLMGRLTKDPVLRQTPSGISVARFTIAVNRRFAKEGQKNADFINCMAWRQTGEFISKYFEKGSMIAVVGEIVTDTYEIEGKTYYKTEVNVNEAYFTGSRQEGNVKQNSFGDDFEDVIGDESDLPF